MILNRLLYVPPPELSEMCGQESSGQGLRCSTGRKI